MLYRRSIIKMYLLFCNYIEYDAFNLYSSCCRLRLVVKIKYICIFYNTSYSYRLVVITFSSKTLLLKLKRN